MTPFERGERTPVGQQESENIWEAISVSLSCSHNMIRPEHERNTASNLLRREVASETQRALLVSNMEIPTFPRFQELPQELQLQIWEQVVLALREQAPYPLTLELFKATAHLRLPITPRNVYHQFIHGLRASPRSLMAAHPYPRLLCLQMFKEDVLEIPVSHLFFHQATDYALKLLGTALEVEIAKLKD